MCNTINCFFAAQQLRKHINNQLRLVIFPTIWPGHWGGEGGKLDPCDIIKMQFLASVTVWAGD